MDFWVRAVVGWALMLGSVAGFAACVVGFFGVAGPGTAGLLSAGLVASTVGFLAGGWLFASRGREATEPGLPEDDSPLANPKLFGTR